MLFYICGYNVLYGQDVVKEDIVASEDYGSAEIKAIDLARNLIEEFPDIKEELEDYVYESCNNCEIVYLGEEFASQQERLLRNEIYEDSLRWEIFPLDDKKVANEMKSILHNMSQKEFEKRYK